MQHGQPLPLAPAGSVTVAPGVELLEVDSGGVVLLWGRAAWCWDTGDIVGRRLAAVQLVDTRSARHGEVMAAFAVADVTLRAWRHDYATGGVEALIPAKRGPKGPSKLSEAKVAEIVEARAAGASMDAVAAGAGVSRDSVSRALAGQGTPARVPASSPGVLEALATPLPRPDERQAARSGSLAEAAPVITQGASLPLAGALIILPALAATGLIEAATTVYSRARSAFYGLASLVLTVVFTALVGEPRAEGLTRINPADLGRLLGLDRAPEVSTVRRRMAGLATEGRSGDLLAALARRHVDANQAAAGVFYTDGHVRAYHGKARLPKAHLARMRLAMPAEEDTWVADARGDGVLVWNTEPGASLVGELRRVATEVRALVRPDARPTIAFDRGGWSPALFAELVAAGFHILTYRKATKVPEPRSAFVAHVFTDEFGQHHSYLLADRRVRIAYRHKAKTRYFACRQIVRLDPANGHQTQVLTTRTDPDPAPIAHAMFSRWRIENFFRYAPKHYNLAAARQAEGAAALAGGRTKAGAKEILDAFAHADAEFARLQAQASAVPAKIPLGQRHPDAKRMNGERKRILDAIRLATYNAESALARRLAGHYARAQHEGRALLREIYASPADLEILHGELHLRITALSAPRRTRAMAALCEELNATETNYPGTDLRLVYSTKAA